MEAPQNQRRDQRAFYFNLIGLSGGVAKYPGLLHIVWGCVVWRTLTANYSLFCNVNIVLDFLTIRTWIRIQYPSLACRLPWYDGSKERTPFLRSTVSHWLRRADIDCVLLREPQAAFCLTISVADSAPSLGINQLAIMLAVEEIISNFICSCVQLKLKVFG